MIYETIVGRNKEDREKFGKKGIGYIGKHIVGTGEEAHLTTKVFIDLIRPHVILISGKRGTGKCVTGDTLVYLGDGRLVEIKEIVGRRETLQNLALNPSTFQIESSKIVRFFEREVDKIIEIKLWNGLEIRTSVEHPFLTIEGWKHANELKVGDWVCIARKVRINPRGKMRKCEIKLLAYLLAEGIIDNSFVWFTNKDRKIRRDFIDSVKKFDENLEVKKSDKHTLRVVGKKSKVINVRIRRKSDGKFDKGTKIFVERNSLLKWLKALGLEGKRAGEKFIPPRVFSLNEDDVALFLKCLFSCDGSIYIKKCKKRNQPIIEYSSKSRKLVEGIYYLLLRFGIVSYIREKRVKKGTYYRLYITNLQDIKTFIKKIGFIGREKLQRKILQMRCRYHSNFYLVPKEIWEYLRRKYKKKEIAKALKYKNWKGVFSKYKYNPLTTTIKKLAEYFDDDYLRFVSSNSITWMRIKNLRTIHKRVKVYDVEVNDKHNFVGNGIILHNSYAAGVILEEMLSLEEEFLNKTSVVIFDPVGIYWSMKFPNEAQAELLREWKIEPKGFKNVKVYVPKALQESYEEAGIPVDGAVLIAVNNFRAEDWILAFNLQPTSESAILLSKHVNALLERGISFSIDDIIERVRNDEMASKHARDVIINFLEVAKGWGILEKEGMSIEDIVKPGECSIIDLSRVRGEEWGVRNLIAAWITREVYYHRVLARKEEELAKVEGRKPRKRFPMTWLVYEEAHNFIPGDRKTVSSDPILTIAKQGREPGIGLICITQMPNKIHPDVLAQTDLVISFRLTAKSDLDALHAVMQTYLREELEKHINRLPRGWHGAAIILDDNLERIFSVVIRPRRSWHAGGTAALI